MRGAKIKKESTDKKGGMLLQYQGGCYCNTRGDAIVIPGGMLL